ILYPAPAPPAPHPLSLHDALPISRPSPRPLRRGDARLVRGGQAARQLDDPVPAPPHGLPRARSHLGDAGPRPDGRRLRRMTVTARPADSRRPTHHFALSVHQSIYRSGVTVTSW